MLSRRWVTAAAVVGAAVFLSAAPELWAAQMRRPQLAVAVTTKGIQGQIMSAGGTTHMLYPSNLKRPGAYGNNKLYETFQYNAYYMRIRAGHGVWSFTSDAKVVYTGPRFDYNDQIEAMQYEVDLDPDYKDVGYGGDIEEGGIPYIQYVPTVAAGYGEKFEGGTRELGFGGNWYPGSNLMTNYRDQGNEPAAVVINNWAFSAYTRDDEVAEETQFVKWTNQQGLTFTEKLSGWSHPDFDDFVLDEIVVENTADSDGDGVADLPAIDQNDLYIGFMDRFAPTASGSHTMMGQYWREERDFIMDDQYQYDNTLKLLSAWDGDHLVYAANWDDTGDPFYDAFAKYRLGEPEGTLMSPQTIGMSVIAYTDDPTSAFAFNARDIGEGYVVPEGDQPFAVRWWESYSNANQTDPRVDNMTEGQMYSEIIGQGRMIGEPPDYASGQFSMLVFGPYDLKHGEKLKIVLAPVGGHPGQVLGNTDMWEWAFKGKQAELGKGLDAQRQNVEAAQFAYDNAYDIPDCPPDVNFRTNSSPQATMQCEWSPKIESAVHPDYGTADIAGYRVYRSVWFDVGPWQLIADWKVGELPDETGYKVAMTGAGDYEFTDKNSVAGFFYHYSVRAYADGQTAWTAGSSDANTHPLTMADLPGHVATHVQVGQEGGFSAQTQRIYAAEAPFAVPSAQSEASEARIWVVPNPYIGVGIGQVEGQESHSYGGTPKIRFVGVPSHCRIRVFSSSGQQVANIRHFDPAKGEADFDQFTEYYMGSIASGVYYYVIENLIEGGNKGKLQRGTFMVIR